MLYIAQYDDLLISFLIDPILFPYPVLSVFAFCLRTLRFSLLAFVLHTKNLVAIPQLNDISAMISILNGERLPYSKRPLRSALQVKPLLFPIYEGPLHSSCKLVDRTILQRINQARSCLSLT